MNPELQSFMHLGTSLAIGLLIGIERGWQERETGEGGRVAGLRTFGLIGLLGGVSLLLAQQTSTLFLVLVFFALAVLLALGYVHKLQRLDDAGITSLVAALLTFVLGALAASGELVIASSCAVVTTLLLGYKESLHSWLGSLQGDELRAGIKLLLISVVLLPILPNQGYGPWQALNPYAIWWLVVLIATISFVGYFAIKLAGTRRGAVYMGLFGGLAASTAVTLHFARLAGADSRLAPVLSTGILLACGTMFPRMLLVASLLNPELFRMLLPSVFAMALASFLPALYLLRLQTRQQAVNTESPVQNPLALKAALSFGLVLALVMLLGKALKEVFGDAGVLSLAAVSGVTDVDAITLSLARMSEQDLALRIAAIGILIAAGVNSLVKAGMAAAFGGRAVALHVGVPLVGSVVLGWAIGWLWLV